MDEAAETSPASSWGGFRPMSLLEEVICLQVVIFAGIWAALALTRGFPSDGSVRPHWVAIGVGAVTVSLVSLRSLVTGRLWLPWL